MNEISTDAPNAMNMRCVTCFSPDRTLKPIKERGLMSIVGPENKIETKSISVLETKAEVLSISPEISGSTALEVVGPHVTEVEHNYEVKTEPDDDQTMEFKIKNDDEGVMECNVKIKNDCNGDDGQITDPSSDCMLISDGDSMDATSESELVINNVGKFSSRMEKEKLFHRHRQSQFNAYDYLQEYIPKIEINENIKTLKDLLDLPLKYLTQVKATLQPPKGIDNQNIAEVKLLEGKTNIPVDIPNLVKDTNLPKDNLQLPNGVNKREITVVNLSEIDEVPINFANAINDRILDKDMLDSAKCNEEPIRNLSALDYSSENVKCILNEDVKCKLNEDVKCKLNEDVKCKLNEDVKCILNKNEIHENNIMKVTKHKSWEEHYTKYAMIHQPGTSGNRKRKREASTTVPGYKHTLQHSFDQEDVTDVKDEQD